MQFELEKGASLDEIRKKIAKGEIQAKVAKQLHHKKYFTPEKIQRKKRDFTQLITKYVVESVKEPDSSQPKALTVVENFAKTKEEQDGGRVLNKKIYKLADKELLVRQRCAADVIFSLTSLSVGIVGIILIFSFFAYYQGTCN